MRLCHQSCLLSLRLLKCPLDQISWICVDKAIFAESVKYLEPNQYAALSGMHKTPLWKIRIHQNQEHDKYVRSFRQYKEKMSNDEV